MKLLAFIENNGEPAPTRSCIIITTMLLIHGCMGGAGL